MYVPILEPKYYIVKKYPSNLANRIQFIVCCISCNINIFVLNLPPNGIILTYTCIYQTRIA